jgi:hypothetical protein
LALLEDFVVGADPNAAEVLLIVDVAGRRDRTRNDVVDGPEGDVIIEKVA